MFEEVKQVEFIEALRSELDAATNAHKQALIRYRKGLNDYLPVLSALSQLQVLERRLVQAELTRLDLRVQLSVALGGSWMAQKHDESEIDRTAAADSGPLAQSPNG